MDIREQIQWLRLQAETPNYMSSRERQRNSDTANTLEALNKVYEAAKNQQKVDRRFVSVELEAAIDAVGEMDE